MPVIGPVAVALPEHRLDQEDAEELARNLLGDGPIVQMFRNGRIRERALAMPVDWYLMPHGFKDRNRAYLDVGLPLVEDAARRALAAADIRPSDLSGIIFVSTTGLATPSMDARLAGRLGCGPDLLRVPLWGLGCAGGVAGLNHAAELARGRPDGHFLVVCLELCSLSFDIGQVAAGSTGKKAVVAASLFADGCAATVVSGPATGATGLRHIRASSHLFPDTGHIMGWDVEDDHLEVVLSPQLPDIVREKMQGLADAMRQGTPIDHWVMHPGGARVLDAYQDALGLSDDALLSSHATLADHGNMSSPTVLFVLQDTVGRGVAAGDHLLLSALGPGFASEMAILRA